MKITRKDFLRLSGLSLLAFAGKGAFRAVTALAGAPADDAAAPVKPVRWGMVIDLAKWRNQADDDKCILACNTAHNIPQIPEPAHQVKWIWQEPFAAVFPSEATDYTRQSYAGSEVPVMCNHCEKPACVRVCPTGATWKREDGIVMMDWHRCIGCKYCVVACPYGARSFNFSDPAPYLKQVNTEFPARCKGVVEKCNFCAERLARGEQPACVEARPDKAMIFGNLADPNSEIRQALRSRFSIRRKPELGTEPNVFYIV